MYYTDASVREYIQEKNPHGRSSKIEMREAFARARTKRLYKKLLAAPHLALYDCSLNFVLATATAATHCVCVGEGNVYVHYAYVHL